MAELNPNQEPEKLELSSLGVAEDKCRELIALFPEVRTESGKIDFDRLKAVLGEAVDGGRERYGMNWPGKAECMRTIQAPSLATLLPCPDQSIDWNGTENLVIEGDNLEVLKLMQRGYLGKIKLIYTDPPYNTGRDFIYPDNYSESLQTYLEYSGQVDSEGRKFGTNTDSDGRFHSKWMNMIYPRLYLARQLLSDTGVLAISIGEGELANLINVCNDTFGEENRITICSRVMKTGGQKGLHFSPCIDYILLYAKNIYALEGFRQEIGSNVIDKVYTKIADTGPRKGERYRAMGLYQAMLDRRANQRFYIECPDGELVIPPGTLFPSQRSEGEQVAPTDGDGVWRWTYPRYRKEKLADNIEFVKSDKTSLVKSDGSKATWNVYYKIWLNDRLEDGQLPGNILEKFESRHSSAELKLLDIPFDFAKPSALIKFLMSVCGVNDGEITLDFFAGSGSTGHAAMELASEVGGKRPFICVQLPERTDENTEEHRAGYKSISEITIERLRRVSQRLRQGLLGSSLDTGFRVFRLASSCFRPWEDVSNNDTEQLANQLSLHIENVSDERNEDDVLTEILMKAGFPLSTVVERIQLCGKTAFSVAQGSLIVSLERELTLEFIRDLANLKPERVVLLDSSFSGNDQLKTNAVQTFKTKGVTSFKVI